MAASDARAVPSTRAPGVMIFKGRVANVSSSPAGFFVELENVVGDGKIFDDQGNTNLRLLIPPDVASWLSIRDVNLGTNAVITVTLPGAP